MFFFSPVNLKVYQLPWFSTAAITKIAPTRMPRQYEAYFLSSGGLKSKIKVPAGFIFPKASLLGLQMAGLLLFLHMVNLLHKNTLGITSSYKYITFMTSFKDCFLNGESLYWICSIQLLFCMYFFFFFFFKPRGMWDVSSLPNLHTLHWKAKIQPQDHQDSPYDLN